MVSGIIPLHWVKDDFIEEVYHLIKNEWPNVVKPARMAFLNRSKDELPTCFVALVDGVAIGHARLKNLESMPRSAYIETVVIDPKFRGKGYGKLLMQKVEDHARDMDFEEMYLFTYDQKGFYERIGYQVCPHFPLHGKPYELWLPDSNKIEKYPDYHRIQNEIKLSREKNQKANEKKGINNNEINQMNGSSETSSDERTAALAEVTKILLNSLTPRQTCAPPPSPVKSNGSHPPPPPPPIRPVVRALLSSQQKVKKGAPPSMIELLSNQIQNNMNLEESEQCLPKISMRKEL